MILSKAMSEAKAGLEIPCVLARAEGTLDIDLPSPLAWIWGPKKSNSEHSDKWNLSDSLVIR